ncbi:ketoacyl-ACP synthase III [Paenibacillus protaetiae]|uniref:Beta-ketoacyl-[acyl-carrier-protein] synthase III n=1 Tax=Paenibacillus protaetiae TaxID=2509456 RepID=A0A4V0YF62_9BACL|nr:ketoacyl-ACP synthase III [Paenibacillus protaetiae]QAY66601.1 ketoacyl-ACP synthase III [Paenibacillus protaetiae]
MTTTVPGSAFRSNAIISAIGSYTPSRVLTNRDLESIVDTSDEWIVRVTGMRERHIAADNEYTSDMIFAAVRNMISRYPVKLDDVDYILVATSTPDTFFPSMAARVQAEFQIGPCGSADIQAACAGLTTAMQLANGLLLSGIFRKILVIGADALSKITDYTDRTTCVLFGDGAGALLMEASPDGQGDVLAAYAETDGTGGKHLYRSSLTDQIGGHPITANGKIVQNGREVYRWATGKVSESIQRFMADNGFASEHIDWFIPHSANMRIIDLLCEKTGIPKERTLSSVEFNGNTSAASIMLALDEGVRNGSVKAGQKLLLYGFGGGLTQAGVIVNWSI